MLFDWTINLGHIFTMLSFIIVGSGVVYTMVGRIEGMSGRLRVLEEDIKTLITVLIQQGKQEERMTAMDLRMVNQAARLDDLTRRYNDKLNNK